MARKSPSSGNRLMVTVYGTLMEWGGTLLEWGCFHAQGIASSSEPKDKTKVFEVWP